MPFTPNYWLMDLGFHKRYSVKVYQVPAPVFESVLAYLARQPWSEVQSAMPTLYGLQPVDPPAAPAIPTEDQLKPETSDDT